MLRSLGSRLAVASWTSLSAALVCVDMSACRSTAGSVSDGRYTAPNKEFSLPIPKMSSPPEIQDGTEKDAKSGLQAGFVSFHDNYGDVRSIDYEQVPPAQASAMSDPERAKQVLSGYVRVAYLPAIELRFPGTRTLSDDYMTLSDGSPAWFSVIVIPGGSSLSESDAEHPKPRKLDSTRAFLFLQKKNLFLTLGTANNLGAAIADNNAGLTEKPPDVERLRSVLLHLYTSMRF